MEWSPTKKVNRRLKWWENRKVKTNMDFKYILMCQIRQTTAEVKHPRHTKTCLLYPHSHQRRQGWHPCHWQKNIPRWSEWTSGFWSSGCRTSDGNGLCSSGTLQRAISTLSEYPEWKSPHQTQCRFYLCAKSFLQSLPLLCNFVCTYISPIIYNTNMQMVLFCR